MEGGSERGRERGRKREREREGERGNRVREGGEKGVTGSIFVIANPSIRPPQP